jgi:hypothetical protein
MKYGLSAKGTAFLTAIECGLIPETDDGYEDEKFSEFWEKSMKRLYRRIMWKATFFSVIALVTALMAYIISLVELLI